MRLRNFKDMLIIGMIIGISIGCLIGLWNVDKSKPSKDLQSIYYKVDEGVEKLGLIEHLLKEIQSQKLREESCDVSPNSSTNE